MTQNFLSIYYGVSMYVSIYYFISYKAAQRRFMILYMVK